MHMFRHALLAGTGTLCILAVAVSPMPDKALAITSHQPKLQLAVRGNPASIRHNRPHSHHVHPRQPLSPNYTVEPTNTLWQIAQVSGITVPHLMRENGLKSDTIYVGQRLHVPSKWRTYVRNVSRTTSLRAWSDRSSEAGRSVRRDLSETPAIADAPSYLIPVYKAAGNRYGIPWTVLAAIHKTETSFAVSDCPESIDGAMGPMQFLPTTFAAYGVTSPGHAGPPNIQNVDDAIYTAANMLSQDGFSQSPVNAIFAYNHSNAYVQRIETLAGLR